jgi:hypothetical protein
VHERRAIDAGVPVELLLEETDDSRWLIPQRGMATERYYQTDVFGPKGALLALSHAWSVGIFLHG